MDQGKKEHSRAEIWMRERRRIKVKINEIIIIKKTAFNIGEKDPH